MQLKIRLIKISCKFTVFEINVVAKFGNIEHVSGAIGFLWRFSRTLEWLLSSFESHQVVESSPHGAQGGARPHRALRSDLPTRSTDPFHPHCADQPTSHSVFAFASMMLQGYRKFWYAHHSSRCHNRAWFSAQDMCTRSAQTECLTREFKGYNFHRVLPTRQVDWSRSVAWTTHNLSRPRFTNSVCLALIGLHGIGENEVGLLPSE